MREKDNEVVIVMRFKDKVEEDFYNVRIWVNKLEF